MSRTSPRRAAAAALAACAALVVTSLPSFTSSAAAAPTDLFLSEYVEGSSNDKALEISNPTGSAIDLAGWTVEFFFNGSTSAGSRIALTGSVPAGDVFVLADDDAVLPTPADQVSASSFFNGDDAIVLRNAGAVVDSIGQLGVDPGSEWGSGDASTADNTLRRKAGAGPDTTTTDPFDPAAEWDGFPQNTFDGLGVAGGGTSMPPDEQEPPVGEESTVTLVSTVQGAGAASSLVGERVTVEAVATSLITSRDVLDGFFLQEEDAHADGDPATSEGIYVFCRTACPSDLVSGSLVRVTGDVAEFNQSTQIVANGDSAIITVGGGGALPSPATVDLPAPSSTEEPATFEATEGMVVTIPTELAVSEYFALARFGEVVLTAGERAYQYTQVEDPSEEGYAAFLADLDTRRIILDDDSNDQNDATSGPLDDEPYFYPTPGLSTESSFRGGDTITGLTGVLEYSFGAWKVRPVPSEEYVFMSANERPTTPKEVGGSLKVASFNVLNYFATIDTTSSGSTGPCGPSGTADCRGADSEAERVRQLDKIVAALSAIDADVYGLIEIQNDDGLATEQIVDALNAEYGRNAFGFVDTGVIGTDAIKQAFVYKRASVTAVNDFETLDSADDPRFVDTRSRPALVQTFQEKATGERVTVAVNHFKSKGSGCGAGDDSPQDGSGNCDGTRTQAAQALTDFLATDPTGSGDPDFLIIGDLNSYARERPITTLETAGYVDLLERFEGEDRYGYVFDGQLGTLDYAMANQPLLGQVTGASGWKINADEVPLFDYDDTVRDAGEAAFERKSTARELYAPDAYRSSDHDPVIVGLDLAGYQVGPGRPDRPGRPEGRGRTAR